MRGLALLIAWLLYRAEQRSIKKAQGIPPAKCPAVNPKAPQLAVYHANKWFKKYGVELGFLPENEFTEIGGITFFLHEETLMASRRGFCENGKITEPSEILKKLFSKLDSVDFY